MAPPVLELDDLILHARQFLQTTLLLHFEQIFLLLAQIHLFLVLHQLLGQLQVLFFNLHVVHQRHFAPSHSNRRQLNGHAFLKALFEIVKLPCVIGLWFDWQVRWEVLFLLQHVIYNNGQQNNLLQERLESNKYGIGLRDRVCWVCLISDYNYQMSQKNPTALQKMQEIANRLISNTPELAKMLDSDSALKPKKPSSPTAKKGKTAATALVATTAKNEMTANDYHERCKDLTSQVQNWKDKCLGLEEQIGIIKQRFVEREIQYRGIIEELQEEIKSKSCLDSNDRNRMQQINELHKEIIDNIASIQNKTSKILIEQQSDIRRFFNKKINEIKDKFKEDRINKNEKDQEYQQKEKQMASELEWIKNIAHKIDEENKTLMKKYTHLKSEFEIQERDKDTLLKELLMKKKQNAALRTQVEQYEKLLSEVSKEMQQSQVRPEILSQSSKNEKASNSKVKTQKTEYNDNKRYENTVSHLNKVIAKERSKVRELKNLYMKEMSNKSELQKIIRKLVQDTRQSIIGIQKDKTYKRKSDELSNESREKLLQKLLSNQKILTLIYDKTFYSGQKNIQDVEIPNELRQILEDEVEGFD